MDSIRCFRESWGCIEPGSIFINQTVFNNISISTSNTASRKGMEAQIRAFQTVISQIYYRGQEDFTCLAMERSPQQMASVLRAWCPKDLITVKVINCVNPAAGEFGDLESHMVTLGSLPANKFLSSVGKNSQLRPVVTLTLPSKKTQEGK